MKTRAKTSKKNNVPKTSPASQPEEFFRNMPVDTGMAFVLVTHLDPTPKALASWAGICPGNNECGP